MPDLVEEVLEEARASGLVLTPSQAAAIIQERVLPHLDALLAKEVEQAQKLDQGGTIARGRLLDRVLGKVPDRAKAEPERQPVVLQFTLVDDKGQAVGMPQVAVQPVTEGEYREVGAKPQARAALPSPRVEEAPASDPMFRI